MVEESTRKVSYNDNNFRKLMSEFKILSTFAAAESWDKQAESEIERIVGVIQELDIAIPEKAQALESIKQQHSKKSLVGRLFNDGNEEKELTQQLEKYHQYKFGLEKMATQLQEAIDFTPNSSSEQKILVKELRQRKKELQLEKREVAAAIKSTHAHSRQQSAQAGAVFGIFYNSKIAASERRNIRYARESALHPQESEKAAIERQLVQIDRDILWAEKFN